MRHVLYKVGFTVLILAAVLGIANGVVMAGSPDSSLIAKIDALMAKLLTVDGKVDALGNNLTAIGGKVDDLSDNLTTIDEKVGYLHTDVAAVYGKVNALGNNLTAIGGTVDGLVEDLDDVSSNMLRMETDEGVIVIPAYTDRFILDEVLGDYDEIRHVVVTLYVYPGSLDETGDRIWVSAYWPESMLGWNVAMFDDTSTYMATTFDFNASKWIIDFESVDTGYTVRYSVTTTYVPAAS